MLAGTCYLAAVGRDHLQIGAGHPDLEFLVPAGLENKRGKAQSGRGLLHLPGRLEDVGAVLGP
jgi:hypothetical protein